jgi:cell division protein FtsW
MLYSASMNIESGTNQAAAGSHYLLSQLSWCGFGVIGCAAATAIDYRKLKPLAPWLLVISVILLACVFAPKIGIKRNGAHRWIGLPGMAHLQPSELAKLALILFLAAYGERYQRQMGGFKKGLLIPGMIIAAVLGLIFIEPDRGCTILLVAVCAAMLVLAGARLLYLAPPALLGGALLALSLLHDPMRLRRILAWLHPEQNRPGAGQWAAKTWLRAGAPY